MQILPHRWYVLLCGLLLLLSLPVRFAAMHQSLWMDEAWVANSLLQPSFHEVLFSKQWAQSTPPLFLLSERFLLPFTDHSEAAFRILPLAASLLGLGMAAVTYRRWLSFPAALLAFTLLCSNYWVIKYPQQVKQYGTDFLVSAILLFLLGRCLESKAPANALPVLMAAAAIGLFLAYPAAFWTPSLLLGAAVLEHRANRWYRLWWPALLLGLGGILEYVVFIRPNRTPSLIQNFSEYYIDPLHPFASARRLVATLGALVTGLPGAAALAGGIGATALALWSVARATRGVKAGFDHNSSDHRSSDRGFMVLLGGALPLLSVISAGVLHLYPVLDYPRMLIFVLPSLALLLGYGVETFLETIPPRTQRILSAAVPAICVVTVLGSVAIYLRNPRPAEENRPAMVFLQSRVHPEDILFVHPGMYEQYKFYRGLLGFRPAHEYLGNEQWPCCATGDHNDASLPSATDLPTDLKETARRAGNHRLWLFLPAGADGHWTAIYRKELATIPAILAANGCTQQLSQPFGQTLVRAFACSGLP